MLTAVNTDIPDNHAADKYFPLYGEISLLFNNNCVFSWKEITQ